MNEKLYIDGEEKPSVEFQGIEDSFGFSWGYPDTESMFPLTGYFPFLKGALGYRFFIKDAISFEKSLRVMIGFGENEAPYFRREFSKAGSTLQLSSVVYWYQSEPHAALPAMLPATERAPAPEIPFWPDQEKLPTVESLKERGVQFYVLCDRPGREIIYAEPGFSAQAKTGYAYDGWELPVYHYRADNKELQIELTVPKKATGTIRVYMIDPDRFEGGRRQMVSVAGNPLGLVANFQEGRWLEQHISPEHSSEGKLIIQTHNERAGSNTVISIIEWVSDR